MSDASLFKWTLRTGFLLGLLGATHTSLGNLTVIGVEGNSNIAVSYMARGVAPTQYDITWLDDSPTISSQSMASYSTVPSSSFTTNGFTITSMMHYSGDIGVGGTDSSMNFHFTVNNPTNAVFTVQFAASLGAGHTGTPYFSAYLREGNTNLIPPIDTTNVDVPYQQYHVTLQPGIEYTAYYYQMILGPGGQDPTDSLSVVSLFLEPIPEPASLGAMSVAATALLMRRRK